MVDRVQLFPFLLLHPRTRFQGERSSVTRTWLKRLLLWVALHRDGSINLGRLYLLTLSVVLTASGLIVYFMLALTEGFPHMGKHYRTICVGKDFVAILLLRSLSGSYMIRNPEEHAEHFRDLDEYLPGVFCAVRRLVYRLLSAQPAEWRWFSSYMGDHILLFAVGVQYIVAFAALPCLYWGVWPESRDPFECFACAWERVFVLFQAFQGAYLAFMLMGFLYCVLEHSAKFRPGAERGARGLLLVFLVLWAPQFLLWYRVHEDVEGYQAHDLHELFQFLGSGPQIFISHSSAMIGAIVLGHHEHFHRCQDLSWTVFFWLSFGLVSFLAISEGYFLNWKLGRLHPKTMKAAYHLALATPYIIKAWEILISILCVHWVSKHGKKASRRTVHGNLGIGSRHSMIAADFMRTSEAIAREESTRDSSVSSMIRHSVAPLDDEEQMAWLHLRRTLSTADMDAHSSLVAPASHSGHGEHHSGPEFLDYDCILIMLTLLVGSVLSFTKVFAHWSLREVQSYLAEVMSNLIFPVAISYFLMVAWTTNIGKSRVTKIVLGLGFCASAFAVNKRSAIEACLIQVAQSPAYGPPICCHFPGLPDFNARKLKVAGHGTMTVADVCDKDTHDGASGHGHGGHAPSPPHAIPPPHLQASGRGPAGGHEAFRDVVEEDDGEGREVGSKGNKHGGEGHDQADELLTLEEEQSTAYFFFETVGSVGQVEFFFTIMGLCLKLILVLPEKKKKKKTPIDAVGHRDSVGSTGQASSAAGGRTLHHSGSRSESVLAEGGHGGTELTMVVEEASNSNLAAREGDGSTAAAGESASPVAARSPSRSGSRVRFWGF